MTKPSGVLGKAVDNRIILTANFFVRFSSSFENSLLSISKIQSAESAFHNFSSL
jgi:hypothetical protein